MKRGLSRRKCSKQDSSQLHEVHMAAGQRVGIYPNKTAAIPVDCAKWSPLAERRPVR